MKKEKKQIEMILEELKFQQVVATTMETLGYRIWTNGNGYKIQKKKLFGCEWLDKCGAWCNWYGKKNPRIFDSLYDALLFIKRDRWELLSK